MTDLERELLAALEDLTGEVKLHKLNVRKDFSLINAHAAATKAIYKAKKRIINNVNNKFEDATASFDDIHIKFACPVCNEQFDVTLSTIIEVGNPYCSECDCETEAVFDFAEITEIMD